MSQTLRWGMLGAGLALLALLLPATARAQTPPGTRRQELEGRVVTRFLDRAARDLELDRARRARLEAVLRTAIERRRGLARQAADLRRELGRALEDPATPDSTFERLLADLADLRARENQLWREEQRDLAAVLTPRQRARFLILSGGLNERIRSLRAGGEAREPPL